MASTAHLSRVATAVVAGGMLAAIAPATAGAAGPSQRVSQTLRAGYGSEFGIGKHGGLTAAERSATLQVRAPDGSVQSSRALPLDPASRMSARANEGKCYESGTRRGFKFLGTKTDAADNDAYYVRFKYFAFKLNNARRDESRGVITKQIEMCSVGGGTPKDGNRVDKVVTLMSLKTKKDRLIDQDWGKGEDKPTATSDLGFKIKGGPVEITGSIPVNPTNKLTGSQGYYDDAPDKFGPYRRNEVNAWWEGGLGVILNAGSSGFQGNVGHALWELPQGAANPKFIIESGFYYHCQFGFIQGCASA
ncbi:MAG: LysR family transcriptional regulator, low CO2-responsive transcriptional regulator [Solirubrobacteraceae bacterium]|jgi:hypothetical protein|nr:LysR family transcriptional regulator, low CO2-responsive transcriptional regulator [Solirubrobacteraceae bacterium]